MHEIEPFYSWKNLYDAASDELSPFFGREYSEFEFTNTIYNYVIHPQWDEIGSETLFIKIIYTEYSAGFTIIEMLGEWNDAINNDIMFLKREIADILLSEGVNKFILIGENVLNFHSSDDSYYEEWFEDVDNGWICLVNFREHVLNEFKKSNIDYYFLFGGEFDLINWRTLNPQQFFSTIDNLATKRLNA